MEDRHGLIVQAMATEADGWAERDAGMAMLGAQTKDTSAKRRTVGAAKNCDTADFVMVGRAMHVTPHVSQNLKRPAAARSMTARPGMTATRRVKRAGRGSSGRSRG